MVDSSSSLLARGQGPENSAVLPKGNPPPSALSLLTASSENAETSSLDLDAITLEEALKKAEEVARTFDRGLHFRFREEAGRYQVEVLDLNDDNKVIRKIPPDDVVKFVAHVREMFGALIDVSA